MPRRARHLVVVLAILVGLAGCTNDKSAEGRADASAQARVSDRAAKSQAALDSRIPANEPGCSAAVGVEGTVVWQGVRGIADLATEKPITPATVFDIGSVSKQFTALAVLMLQADGKLSLDDRVGAHVHGLPEWAKTVTLEQLMHHTSAIPDDVQLLVQHNIEESDRVTNAQGLRVLNDVTELASKPGTVWEYSNSNYLLLGEVVHQVTGTPLAQHVRDTIFEPLGLDMVIRPASAVPGKAESYRRQGDEFEPQRPRWELVGAGGVQTTPTELVRWADNYRTGALGGPGILSAQLKAAVPVSLGNGGASEGADVYGAGIVESEDGSLNHSGGWPGFQTWFEVSPDRRTALAVTCNLWDTDPAELADSLRPLWV